MAWKKKQDIPEEQSTKKDIEDLKRQIAELENEQDQEVPEIEPNEELDIKVILKNHHDRILMLESMFFRLKNI